MLLSTLLFVSFTALLLVGLSVVIRNQAYQLRLTQHAYTAKSMVEMTATILQKELDEKEAIDIESVSFTAGTVQVVNVADDHVLLSASLEDGFTTERTIPLIIPEVQDDVEQEKSHPKKEEQLEGNDWSKREVDKEEADKESEEIFSHELESDRNQEE